MQVRIQQLGPGMMQQIQSMCGECHGEGERVDPKLRCKKCNGRKVNRERKILEVSVDKGMEDGQKVTFSGEGDQEPGLEPGDIIIVLDEKAHALFKRNGQDLIMKMDISLTEALTGLKKAVKTLDDRTLVIQTVRGEVIKTGDLKMVRGEGMPQYRNPFEKGRLIILFPVKWKKMSVPKEQLTAGIVVWSTPITISVPTSAVNEISSFSVLTQENKFIFLVMVTFTLRVATQLKMQQSIQHYLDILCTWMKTNVE